jgi:class 3 adenylate cyclase/tetratricopeptide (TPR) repeat protein
LAVESQARRDRIAQALRAIVAQRAQLGDETFALLLLGLLRQRRLAFTRPVQAQPEDEIRQISVMFVDVVGSSMLAQTMGPGAWKTTIAASHDWLARIVTCHDGEIGQYLGDGVLCYFGARQSQRDDGLRAVRCALQIASEARAGQHRLAGPDGSPLRYRIAIATGRTVVGLVGGGAKQELLALGPTPNRAARLQTAAPANGVLVDEATFVALDGAYAALPQTITLPEPEGSAAAYLILRAYDASEMAEAIPHRSGAGLPFAGREGPLAQLQAAWDACRRDQRPHCVFISGDIGVGKTALWEVWLRSLPRSSYIPTYAVSRYEERDRPYNLMADFVTRISRLSDDMNEDETRQAIITAFMQRWQDARAEQAAAIVGQLAGFDFTGHPALATVDAMRHKRASALLAAWMTALARQRPLVAVADNMQWSDFASADLLIDAFNQMGAVPALFILVGRPETLTRHPTVMASLPVDTHINLGALPAAAIAAIVEAAVAPVTNLPADLRDLIVARAEGNPLFVTEFLNMLYESGVFYASAETGRWHTDYLRYEEVRQAVPRNLLGVFQARLDDLQADVRHVLQAAAVVGMTFWEGLLETLVGREVGAMLDLLVQRQIVLPRPKSELRAPEAAGPPERQYRIAHTLYRDVALEMVPEARRQAYQAQIAEWLIARVAGVPQYYPLLAGHFAGSGQVDVALFITVEAARTAVDGHTLRNSLVLGEEGLSLARHVPREVALPCVSQIWHLRGEALLGLHRAEEASAALQTALELQLEMADALPPAVRSRTQRMLSLSLSRTGRYREANAALEAALAGLPPDDRGERARVWHAQGALNLMRGQLDLAMYSATAAMHIEAGMPAMRGPMAYIGQAALERGNPATALDYFEAINAQNRLRQHQRYMIEDLLHLGIVYETLRLPVRAEAAYREAATLAEALSGPERQPLVTLGLVRAGLALGRSASHRLLDAFVIPDDLDYYEQLLVHDALMETCLAAGQTERVIDIAMANHAYFKRQNRLLYGRLSAWWGIAEARTDAPGAADRLRMALAIERTLGGRLLPRLYSELAAIRPALPEQAAWAASAQAIEAAWRMSLGRWPDLQGALAAEWPQVPAITR